MDNVIEATVLCVWFECCLKHSTDSFISIVRSKFSDEVAELTDEDIFFIVECYYESDRLDYELEAKYR